MNNIKCFTAFFCAICLCAANSFSRENGGIKISADYAGGNVIVENIDNSTNTVLLKQDLRDTVGWWFYWNFEAQNIGGKTVTFKFLQKQKPRSVLGAMGPAFSIDGGKTWSWLDPKLYKFNEFSFTAPQGVNSARFAFCVPYTLENLNSFVKEMNGKNGLEISPLCKTPKGGQNFCISLNQNPSKSKKRVLLTSRHHACEASGSYVLEGFMRELFSDSPEGKELRQLAEFFIIPMMDLDGVEAGDQGKNRNPHDHNRDYIDAPLYPSVRAVKSKLLEWEKLGGTDFAMDFHSPYIGIKPADGKTFSSNTVIYLVGLENPILADRQKEFSKILEQTNTSELPFLAGDFMPHGKSWNKGSYKTSMANFAASLKGTKFASSLETPYSLCRTASTSPERFRAFGACVAKSVLKYLKQKDVSDRHN